jgi:hypothetical protein
MVPFGTTKAKEKNTLMTAIRHSCSLAHIYIYIYRWWSLAARRKKKNSKVLILYISKRRWRKNSFQLINFISSIIIEMSSMRLKFETYRYKRVNDRSVLMTMMKTSEWLSFSHSTFYAISSVKQQQSLVSL